jgi:hypothetical protein
MRPLSAPFPSAMTLVDPCGAPRRRDGGHPQGSGQQHGLPAGVPERSVKIATQVKETALPERPTRRPFRQSGILLQEKLKMK